MDEKWMSNNVWKDMQDSFGIHHLAVYILTKYD